jgi:hypothetical protein
MKFRVQADQESDTIVVFEPWGEQRLLAAGDHVDVVLPLAAGDDEISFGVEYAPGMIILHQEVIDTVYVWDSSGREIGI